MSNDAVLTYTFLSKEYKNILSLFTALALNWEEGKKQLYQGKLSSFFESVNPKVANICLQAEEKVATNIEKEDIVFWAFLYKICPNLDGLYWRGRVYESVPALGKVMLEKLWENDKLDCLYWDSILENRLLSKWFLKVKYSNDSLSQAVEEIETSYSEKLGKRDKELIYYAMAYRISGERVFVAGNNRFKNVNELATFMKKLLESSYEKFVEFCHSLISYDDVLDVQLEAWLIALGKSTELEKWRKQLQ